MELFTVEIWQSDPFDIRGKWVYTIKSTEYEHCLEHKEFLEANGYKARLTPELH